MAHFHAPILTRPASFNFAEDVVDYWASQSPSQRALFWVSQDGSQTADLTYVHFSRESHRLCVLLQKLGVNKGERMLVILPRLPVWWELATACLRSGIVLCPATTLLVNNDIQYRCTASSATVFVGDQASVAKFLSVRSACPAIKHVLQVDGTPPSGVQSLPSLLSSIPADAKWTGPKPEIKETSLIYFTSGTTGYPKMVQHNQISYPLAHLTTGKHWLRLRPGKLYWNLSEQGWAKAAWSFFASWNCGAALFVHDDRLAFSPERTIGMLAQYPITQLCAPPTVYRQLVLAESQRVFEKTRPKALEHCVGAGEPLNGEVIRLWKEMHGGMEICDGYGQTETIMVCGNLPGKKIKPGSMGSPPPGIPLKVIGEDGAECKVGEEGDMALEVVVEGAGEKDFFGVFDGYIKPDGTLDRRLQAAAGGAKGKSWYRTGDRATRDEDGYFWFVGRSDDVIGSAGYRIGPFEVESTLKLHPAVVESAVVSSPDAQRGEVVKAFIVLTAEYASKEPEALIKEMQDFCKEQAAPYKYPRKIQFVDASFLPKTISGKIKRNELKQMEWAQSKDKVSAKL